MRDYNELIFVAWFTSLLSGTSKATMMQGRSSNKSKQAAKIAKQGPTVGFFLILTSALIILMAVGAVNMLTTLCCSITRKNPPASGVPTGLP